MFSKVGGHIINPQKLIIFKYISNTYLEINIKQSLSFMIALKNLKHLGLNLTKYVYDPNTELQTIVEDDLMKRKSNCIHLLENQIEGRCQSPNLIYRFGVIPTKISGSILIENEKLTLKFAF